MFKKIMAWVLVVSLTATIAIGATLAYLTDRDSEANVFTVGNVSIDLEEDFDQGATLIPGVDIEKKPTITNTGANDAWVWATIAIPTALDDSNDASKNVVHFNYNHDYVTDYMWTWQDPEGEWMIGTETIDGVAYNVYTVLYQTPLKPGETTPDVIYKVYLDPHVDIDPDGNMAWVEDGVATDLGWNIDEDGNPVIYVSAYAMQTEGFASVYEAYDAYQTQWAGNGTEWGTPATLVSTADELQAALAAGKDVALTADIALTDGVTVPVDANVILDLNGKNITMESEAAVSMITNNGSLTINGTGKIAYTFTGTPSTAVAANTIENRGVLVVNGGEISNTGTGNQIGYGIDNRNGSTLTVNGGTITATGSSYYDGIRLMCGTNNDTTVTVNGGKISSIWAQNPSANKASAVKGTVVINGGTVTTTYYENYTTVKVAEGVTAVVEPYGAGRDNTTSAVVDGYTVYSFVH